MTVNSIFAKTAPLYWRRDLPVIPLRPMEKKAFLPSWSDYCKKLPSQSEQANWLEQYPNNNIGLALGDQSGLMMMDIDTDDPIIMKIIMDVLAPFPSPWKRIGKKGMALAYKQPKNQDAVKTFRLRSPESKTMTYVECLSNGTQLVLPPSIHPDTKRPYEANCELWQVIDQVPHLPADIEDRFRAAFDKAGLLASGRRSIEIEASPNISLETLLEEARGRSGRIEDGRNELGTRIRAQVFRHLKSEDNLDLKNFINESWQAFVAACETAPTITSSNQYTFEGWAKTCQGDYSRLRKKFASKGKLLTGIRPHWTGTIVSLKEGQETLDSTIRSFFGNFR